LIDFIAWCYKLNQKRMLFLVVAFLGGLLTIVSPCILPVLPFVFSRADQPFRRSGLPLLAGMACTFAGVAALATTAGSWIVRANQVGRGLAMIVFAVLGLALVFPAVADHLSRPFVHVGRRLDRRGEPAGAGGAILLGVSTGLLWVPCAGPILGLILTGAALEGPGVQSGLLLCAFAAGAATALAVALLAGQRVFVMLKRSLGADLWIRRGLGAAVLLGVVGVASGMDTGVLARISLASTGGIEQRLVARVRPTASPPATARVDPSPQSPVKLENEGAFPSLAGAVAWLNTPPLTTDGLRGRVVVIDFWTYSCINCLRAIPYVEAWAEKYKASGLVVIGVHTPEFAFEKDLANVKKAVQDLKLTYPVAVDSNYGIWRAFKNEYWPAHYFIDARGTVRYHHFGEGQYDESERVIRELLKEKNASLPAAEYVNVTAAGVQAAPSQRDVKSPETYVGFQRLDNYVSPETIRKNQAATYTASVRPRVNQWGLVGSWNVRGEDATLVSAPGKIIFRFHARDLHLVLGPGSSRIPVRFRVRVDGAPPLEDRGVDVDAQGSGTVSGYRLYQLIRQKGPVEDRTFEIEFLDPGVQAFAFTFG
jgi:cytochrome c biogenesis protein CcdA/thiol-disulfide isomerase/thioredoxin